MRSLAVASFALLALACCDNTLTCPSTPPTFAEVNRDIIQVSCAHFDVCHSAAGKKGDLDLETSPYEALVNAPTSCQDPCVSGKTDFPVRVKPSDLAHSFMWVKLNLPESKDPKYGYRMPQSNPSLDPDTLNTIQCWIQGGAPK
jgi:hypothetical protein